MENFDLEIDENKRNLNIIINYISKTVKGVNGYRKFKKEDLLNDIKNSNPSDGIKINKKKDLYIIDINLVVDYGYKIPDLTWDVQNKIKEYLESSVRIKVEKVNIHISSISFD